MAIEIQRLQPGEEERLQKVRLDALKDAPDAFGTTFQEANTWSKSRWSAQLQSLPTFIALLNGQDSGSVRSSPHAEKTTVAELISMWVAPEARGIGLGEALIDAVISWARAESYSRLVLEVSNENRFAIALYKRKGFQATGKISSFPYPRQQIREQEMAMKL